MKKLLSKLAILSLLFTMLPSYAVHAYDQYFENDKALSWGIGQPNTIITIKNKLALKNIPTHIIDVNIPKNIDLRFGVVKNQSDNPNFDSWGEGGAEQFEIIVENLANERIPSSWFPDDSIRELIN